MHLARVVLEHVHKQQNGQDGTGAGAGAGAGANGRKRDRLRAIYFDLGDEEFPEVQAFVDETAARFDLELVRSSSKFKEGIQQCIDEQPGQQLAFVLGTRDSDPNARGQESFSPSSDWLPPFMRVNPIIHWYAATPLPLPLGAPCCAHMHVLTPTAAARPPPLRRCQVVRASVAFSAVI